MSTISPVTSLVAASDFSFPGSAASASGAVASAAVKASVTASLIDFGILSVLEYMPETSARTTRRSIVSPATAAFDETSKLGEKIAGIMRAGRGLGMILHAEDG